jgi:prepilin-type N-terminal cleavage/methylation domain-containing protein
MKLAEQSEHSKAGFTLIELLIVTSLVVILSLTVSAMFMTFLITNARTNTKNTLKVEGSHALSQMEHMLRNSYQLVENSDTQICQSNMDSIALESVDGGRTEFRIDNSSNPARIASNSAHLTSDRVAVVANANSLKFDCVEGSSGARSVTIKFQLSKIVPSVNNTTNEASTESFSAIVSLRN